MRRAEPNRNSPLCCLALVCSSTGHWLSLETLYQAYREQGNAGPFARGAPIWRRTADPGVGGARGSVRKGYGDKGFACCLLEAVEVRARARPASSNNNPFVFAREPSRRCGEAGQPFYF